MSWSSPGLKHGGGLRTRECLLDSFPSKGAQSRDGTRAKAKNVTIPVCVLLAESRSPKLGRILLRKSLGWLFCAWIYSGKGGCFEIVGTADYLQLPGTFAQKTAKWREETKGRKG